MYDRTLFEHVVMCHTGFCCFVVLFLFLLFDEMLLYWKPCLKVWRTCRPDGSTVDKQHSVRAAALYVKNGSRAVLFQQVVRKYHQETWEWEGFLSPLSQCLT